MRYSPGEEEKEASKDKHMLEVRCNICDVCRYECRGTYSYVNDISRVQARARCSIDGSRAMNRSTHHTKMNLKPVHPSDPTTGASLAPS